MNNLLLTLLFLLNLINHAVYTSEQKPVKNPKKEKKFDYFILRFQTTGDPKSDKEFEEMLLSRSLSGKLFVRLMSNDESTHTVKTTSKDLINHDHIFSIWTDPIKRSYIKGEVEPIRETYVGSELIDSIKFDYSKKVIPNTAVLPIGPGKKYTIRLHCTDAQLKNPNFKKLNLIPHPLLGDKQSLMHEYDEENPNPRQYSLCIEEQDIAEKQKEVIEKLEEALPDFPTDIREVIADYNPVDYS